MKYYMRSENSIRTKIGNKPPLLMLFAIGFCFGIVIMNIYQNSLLINTGLLDEYTLYNLKYLSIDSRLFFLYILRERFQSFFFILIFATTYLGIIMVWLYSLGIGISFGMLFSACVIRYGMKGVSLIAIGLFPHGLILVPLYIFILYWAYEICISIYFKDLYTGSFLFRNHSSKWKWLLYFIAVFFALFISCTLESYVNPKILIQFLQIF